MLTNDVGIYDPAARHPKMKNQRVPAVCLNKPIFGTSPQPRHARALQALPQVNGDWTAKIGTPGFDVRQHRAVKNRGKPANGGFDLWKLWHGFPLAGGAALG
jgi:hypothetical protein